MTRVDQPISATLRQEALRVRAQRELADLEQDRFVVTAVDQGVSQDAIADVLGVPLTTVARIITRLDEQHPPMRPTVSDVMNRAAADDIDRAEMLRQLLDLNIDYRDPPVAPESDWAVLRRFLHDGLLARADAEQVAQDVARRLVARVATAMDLEDQTIDEPVVAEMIRETTDRLLASLG